MDIITVPQKEDLEQHWFRGEVYIILTILPTLLLPSPHTHCQFREGERQRIGQIQLTTSFASLSHPVTVPSSFSPPPQFSSTGKKRTHRYNWPLIFRLSFTQSKSPVRKRGESVEGRCHHFHLLSPTLHNPFKKIWAKGRERSKIKVFWTLTRM